MTTVTNGVNVQALLDAREVLKGAPEAAQFTWRASAKWQSGVHSQIKVQSFFGLGQDSLEENRTNYLLRSSEASADVQWRPGKLFDIGGGFAYLTPTVGTGTDSRYPTTDQVFNPAAIR